MKQLIYSAFVCALILTACGERSVGGNARVNTVAPAPAAAPVQSNAPAATPLANPAQAATNTATATAALNPAHGQPGHRCDIAVGAPLPAGNAATSVQQALPAATNALPAAPAIQPVAAGLNPAHGQPGHRCDIAVGAPLNSKPAGK